MKNYSTPSFACLTIFLSLLSVVAGCDTKSPPVSYSNAVAPVLQKHCAQCHTGDGAGLQTSGFSVADYAAVMQGTKFGPVIIPGDPLSSTLVILLEGKAHPSINMPQGGNPSLKTEQINAIKTWIAQGAAEN